MNLFSSLKFAGRMICQNDENPDRRGLRDTPSRFAAAYLELLSGPVNPQLIRNILKTFDDIEASDGMVTLTYIEFVSLCEHHILPFFGHAHIAYLPRKNSKKIVGISKLARLLDCYASRLQVQERLGRQVVSTLMEVLNPLGAMCVIDAQHLCITARGVKKADARMRTAAFDGVFAKSEVRQEFYELIKLGPQQ
jgi:GTP cyclohydrolase I